MHSTPEPSLGGTHTRPPPTLMHMAPASDAHLPDPPGDIWYAACMADVPALCCHLSTCRVLPDQLHPMLRMTPLLAAACVRTEDAAVDARLKEVMRVLRDAGDPLRAVEPFSGNTALHILAAQGRGWVVKHRLEFLAALMVRGVLPRCNNMLTARNAAGELPEECAATKAIWCCLVKSRRRYQPAADCAGDVPLCCATRR
eukprot:jgi/Ulvmu1/8426/UM043_0004.1